MIVNGSLVALDELLAPRCGSTAAAGAAAPWFHAVPGRRPLVLVVAGSRVYELSPELHARLMAGDPAGNDELRSLVSNVDRVFAEPAAGLVEPASLSLNLAQACNLSCAYCYADEGRFGGQARLMPLEVALEAIDRLIAGSDGRRVTIGFIGGEPFLNREVLHRCVDHARAVGRRLGIPVGFSVTTNATLLTSSDLDLLRAAGFAISVSLDGAASSNDRYRRSRHGSAFARVLGALGPLLQDPGSARIAARVTVPRTDLRVGERVDELAAAGFREIGVSPLRTSADPALQLRLDDWPAFLAEMVRAADREWERVREQDDGWRFSNLAIALKEIHRGSCRPLPCGAALGYVSLGADGDYFTCHRTIDDPRFQLGSLAEGLDHAARARFLRERHVDRQEPCRSCWARYLCGGGCHAEVIAAGRGGCDYIRGWLEHCLTLYDVVLTERPDLLAPPGTLA